MPLLYWMLTDIQQTTISGGFTIVTTTDVACHQWLRWTASFPQKHPKEILRRGLLVMWDARFCFVNFFDLEQNEAGDTYTHTFTWTGWVTCETKYFYFWATNAGEPMISTSPIFSKHYIAPPFGPPITELFYTTFKDTGIAADGRTRYRIASQFWPVIHDGPGNYGSPNNNADVIGIDSGLNPPLWDHIFRGIINFDTTLLPVNAFINSAFIRLHHDVKNNTFSWEPNLCIVSNFAPDPSTVIAADYPRCGIIPCGDLVPYAAWGGGESLIDLNPYGLGLINKGGVSQYGVREEWDRRNIPPPWESRKVCGMFWSTYETGSPANRPYLSVTYQLPL